MSIKILYKRGKLLLSLLFPFYLLTALPVLISLQAEQTRELDRKNNWILSVRDVPIVLPPDYQPSSAKETNNFLPYYQVLILKSPEGSLYELSLTDEGLYGAKHEEVVFFYPLQKARFGADWNKDGRPEIILTILTGGYYLKDGRANPTEPDLLDLLINFRPGSPAQEGSFQILGTLGRSSGISSDIYPAVLPHTQESWPEIYEWAQRTPGSKIVHWTATRYTFKKDKYESTGSWRRIGFASPEDIGQQSTDLLREKGVDSGPPTVYLRDNQVYLRAQDNTLSQSLGLMKKGTELYLLTMHGPSVEIGERLAPWFKVQVQSGSLKGQVGWVYGAFITPWAGSDPALAVLVSPTDSPNKPLPQPSLKPSGSLFEPVAWVKVEPESLQAAKARKLDRKDNWVLLVRDVLIEPPANLAELKAMGWDVILSYQVLILESPQGDVNELWLTDKGLFPNANRQDLFFYPLKKAQFAEDLNKDGIPEIALSLVMGGYFHSSGMAVPASHDTHDYLVSFQP